MKNLIGKSWIREQFSGIVALCRSMFIFRIFPGGGYDSLYPLTDETGCASADKSSATRPFVCSALSGRNGDFPGSRIC